MFGLSKDELKIFKKFSTPIKILNFLDTFPINWEKKGETYMSPRRFAGPTPWSIRPAGWWNGPSLIPAPKIKFNF